MSLYKKICWRSKPQASTLVMQMSAVATTDDMDAAQYDDEKVIGATYTIPVLEVKEQRRKEWQRQKAVARCTAIQVSVMSQPVVQ